MSVGRNQFVKKGYGRIYVMDPSKVGRVLEIVREVDPSEFDGYYPKKEVPSMVAPFEGKVELVYTYKFESSIDTITLRCWRERISVWCISQHDDFVGLDQADLDELAREREAKDRARAKASEEGP